MYVSVSFLGSGALETFQSTELIVHFIFLTKLKCFTVLELRYNLILLEVFLTQGLGLEFGFVFLLRHAIEFP